MEYKYSAFRENEKQYDKIDLRREKIVNAEYKKSELLMDQGNPYIEALPEPRSTQEILSDYNRLIIDYDWVKQKNMEPFDRMKALLQLREVRFVMPFHFELEEQFNLALVSSYRARTPRLMRTAQIVMGDKQGQTEYVIEGGANKSTCGGIALIGCSGCGKSAATEILVSHYPQVIVHPTPNGGHFVQIVYICVTCPANSSFKALYQSIGKAIDRALNNEKPFYERAFSNAKMSIGEKTNLLCEIVDTLGIGCIILDEITIGPA